jgi:hypothetical protein
MATVVPTSLRLSRDCNRWIMEIVCNQSPYIAAMVFSGAAAKTSTPPTGARFVKLSTTAAVYFKIGGSAAVPAADVTDGSASRLLSPGETVTIDLEGATTVGVAAGAAAVVTLVYYT